MLARDVFVEDLYGEVLRAAEYDWGAGEGVIVVFVAGHYYDRGHRAHPLKGFSAGKSASSMVFGIRA